MEPIVLVHGGAGDIPVSRVKGKIDGVKKAATTGYTILINGGSVLDAVEEAVKSMELDDNFNAGYGSVLTLDGTVEMEACIMDNSMKAGCVSLVKNIHHPISLARKVMSTPHNFLAGDRVNEFAVQNGFEILPDGALVTEYAIKALEEWKEAHQKGEVVRFAKTEVGPGEVGTVGAVAIDANGNMAAATSTGGITGKYSGRVGDTPIIGAGNCCNAFGAVSTTGHGETIMKASLAKDILARIEYCQTNAQKATQEACKRMTELLEGTGGAITIDNNGQVGVSFTSKRMAWAYQKENAIFYGIEKDEIILEAQNEK